MTSKCRAIAANCSCRHYIYLIISACCKHLLARLRSHWMPLITTN
ncbi:MAG: hypothetical protein EPO23_02535 [Xanthobacteraceae bacterium]|nr:MAG: hypothetical protein EPO23_02535 [Xanthobacteraceae bacterium]